VFADLLSRYLEFRGYSVTHVMNITDLDDKTILGSKREGEEISSFTEKHIRGFKKDCETIGIKPADQYPRASQHVEDMVLVAKKLVQKGYAYEKLRSIYFNISRFAEYGQLSGIDIDKIKVGTTVDLDEYEKDNPRDFTLMKRAKLSELKRGIYTKTDWGNVRPSWHIQCAAMSMKYLGETYDIHTASRELVFPHHENKLAIAMSLTGKSLAKYWLHCDRVLVQGKKVDEKGVAPAVSDLVQIGYTGREIRYWLLSTHYHKPVAYAAERLDEARSALKRLDTCVDTLLRLTDGVPYHELDQLVYDIKQGFINAMDDDLNISAGMASIFKNIKRINLLLLEQNIDPQGASKIVDTLRGIDTVLGIFEFSAALSDPEIQKLIQKRERARAAKNWDLADKIRDQLQSSGVCVRDQKTSPGDGI